jgi:glucose-6-phosphate isomerase
MAAQDQATLWHALETLEVPTLATLFADPARRALCHHARSAGRADRFDWSKTHLSAPVEEILRQLADAADFVGKREELLSGAKINNTEGRAAEHTAQRGVGAEASVEEARPCMPAWRCWSMPSTKACWARSRA